MAGHQLNDFGSDESAEFAGRVAINAQGVLWGCVDTYCIQRDDIQICSPYLPNQ